MLVMSCPKGPLTSELWRDFPPLTLKPWCFVPWKEMKYLFWIDKSTAIARTRVPAVWRGQRKNFLETKWCLCGDEVGKEMTLCVKGFSVLWVSEQAVLSSYSQFITNKRGKLFLFCKRKELLSFFSRQDMGKAPHSPAHSKQQSSDPGAAKLPRNHCSLKRSWFTSWSTLQYS